MATIKRFEDLHIWQLARELAKDIYESYKQSEPFLKDFKLKEQINASSGSIMDNIAEGFERGGTSEFIYFLSISKGSSGEVKSQLYRAHDRNYINYEKFTYLYNKTDEVGREIGGFIIYLKQSGYKGQKYKEQSQS
jgi:four helix bundle protein